MKFLRLLAILLAAFALSCKPEALPDGNNDKENTENTGNGDDDGPSRPIRPGGDNENGGENGDSGNDEGNDDEPTVPEQPTESYYVKVAEDLSDWSGDYLITYTSSGSILVFNDFDGIDKGISTMDLNSYLTADGIHSDYGDPYKAVISKVGNAYSVYLTGIGYIGLETSSNKVHKSGSAPTSSDTDYLWTFSYGSEISMTNLKYNTRDLRWNSDAKCFRCYSSGQKDVTLYRRGISTGSTPPDPEDPDTPVTPDPTPDPEGPDTPATPETGGNSAGYLNCYDVPFVSTTLAEGDGYSSKVQERYGNTYAYIYETTNSNQRVVTHTFSNGGRVHRNYTFLYDYDKHCPIWLSYHMNSGYCGKGGSRTDAWGYDPAIPQSEQPNLSSSYCSDGNPYNRGHMIASHARSAIRVANQQAFY